MVRTQIQLTEEQSQRLKAAARRTGLSVSELIRRGVDAVVDQMTEPSPDVLYERARSVAGRFKSEESDVAARHDDYLGRTFIE